MKFLQCPTSTQHSIPATRMSRYRHNVKASSSEYQLTTGFGSMSSCAFVWPFKSISFVSTLKDTYKTAYTGVAECAVIEQKGSHCVNCWQPKPRLITSELCTAARVRCPQLVKKTKPFRGRIQEEKKLEVFDHQIHQKLATDVVGVSFDAQWYEGFGYGHGSSIECVILELRGLGWSST